MKKHLLKVIGILAISASAYAIAPNQTIPPVTEGIGNTGSTTEVRVTANVVAGIAVNEASPIDFGNLVRGKGVYTQGEVINEQTPGVVVFRADKSNEDNGGEPNGAGYRKTITATLDTDNINLYYQQANGTTGNGTNEQIKNVKITGLAKAPGTTVDLVDGKARRLLHANFKAYDKADLGQDYSYDEENGNLGKNQKLGSYLGSVKVSATVK